VNNASRSRSVVVQVDVTVPSVMRPTRSPDPRPNRRPSLGRLLGVLIDGDAGDDTTPAPRFALLTMLLLASPL